MKDTWRWLVAFVAGLVLGLAGGLVLAPTESGPRAPQPPPPQAHQQTPPPDPGTPGDTHQPGKDQTRRQHAAATSNTSLADTDATNDPIPTLRARVQQLERQLAFEKALRRELEGAPVPFPNKVKPRFHKEELHKHLKASIESTGIDAALENIDCEEFPCIAYGVVASDIDADAAMADLRLLHQEALDRGYKGDAFYISHTTQEPEDGLGQPQVVFNISYYPSDLEPEDRAAMDKRLKVRKDRYFEALK